MFLGVLSVFVNDPSTPSPRLILLNGIVLQWDCTAGKGLKWKNLECEWKSGIFRQQILAGLSSACRLGACAGQNSFIKMHREHPPGTPSSFSVLLGCRALPGAPLDPQSCPGCEANLRGGDTDPGESLSVVLGEGIAA